MSRPKIFISYSHKDIRWKNLLVGHLGILANEGDFDVWVDDRISAGDDWMPAIERAINEASAAILLISIDFLNSPFIRGTEVPRLLERRQSEGMLVIPVIARPAAWDEVKWLAGIQARPRGGRALSAMPKHEAEEALGALTKEVRALLLAEVSSLSSSATGRLRVAASRLPVTGRHLFGRDDELAMLDAAWDDPDTHIVVVVGSGGMGKSSLVSHWRDKFVKAGQRGATRIFDWSFYDQGATSGEVSGDSFIEAALTWFGDPISDQGSPWSKGERLAALIASTPTLMVLDGLEPLQHPPGPNEGRLHDQALQALLRGLAERNTGLCVVTTRIGITDLQRFEGRGVQQQVLKALSPRAGAELLRAQQVQGSARELERASAEFDGHPLALTLLGGLLRDAFGCDIRCRNDIECLTEDIALGGHAKRVIASYAAWFANGAEIRLLRVVGLFDRPVPSAVLNALLAPPAIPQLTDGIIELTPMKFRLLVAKLQNAGLLSEDERDQSAERVLGAHPLVRQYFREDLRTHSPEAWREGNRRIFFHLVNSTSEYPDTLDRLEPLFASIRYGCHAGLYKQALDIYQRRINRGSERYSLDYFNAFGANLVAISNFFDVPWSQPSASLGPEIRAWVLNNSGWYLTALGRTREAVNCLHACISNHNGSDPVNLAIAHWNLCTLYTLVGKFSEALTTATTSMLLSDHSGEHPIRYQSRTQLANVLHRTGQLDAAERVFAEALQLVLERFPREPYFVSISAFHYCEYLLTRERHEEARIVSTQALVVAVHERWPLEIGYHRVALGGCYLALAQSGTENADSVAAELIESGLEILRHDGMMEFLIYGYLQRSKLALYQRQLERARSDLAEALALAQNCGMRMYEVEAHINFAKLFFMAEDRIQAQDSLATARELIQATGYNLRMHDVSEVETVLRRESLSAPE